VLEYQANHASDPLYKMSFNGLTLPRSQLLGSAPCIWRHWEQAMGQTIIHLASYAIGAAARIHEIAVEYAKYRHAFGRAIGGFQSIAHYLADVAVGIEGARTLVYQAAWFCDQGRDYLPLAAMAKLQACDVFCRAAAVAIQVHGGLGYTIEADPQLFFRRAKQIQLMHWGPAFLEQRIADHVLSAAGQP
jgi:alkylation response protein AidB-like acyl-CoA dehydrogenase